LKAETFGLVMKNFRDVRSFDLTFSLM
jgi:hypothetical protein